MSKLSYRQIHLDFHTPDLPFTLGKNFDKKTFQKRLLKAHVTSVTLTGRCHHGHIYYKTDLPAQHPQMKGDFLMEEVDACHEVGIKAPIYLTVGWDAYSADKHPEWLERKPDGTMYGFEDYGQLSPGWKTLCFNSPYLDYLKEQIIDTMQHFEGKLDGLFFDIVWQDPCSCNFCVKKMLKEGLNPQSESDCLAFAERTEQYLKDQIYETVKAQKEDCPIFFNEGNIEPNIRKNLHDYSHLEIESLPSGQWGYQHFPTVVRYVKNLGKEYVGMTGKFHKVWADFGSYKNQAALEYESFLALAHGAKCSIGDQMYPDGSLQEATYDLIGSVYQEVEKLEKYNEGSEAVTQIAVLHPGIVEKSIEKVDLSLAGAVNILNEGHYQFDIVDSQMDWSQYKLLILADKIVLNGELKEKIVHYLRKTKGKIIASYKSGLIEGEEEFPAEWGLDYKGENPFQPTYGVYDSLFQKRLPKGEIVLHGPGLLVKPKDAQVLGKEYRPLYQRNYQHYFSHFQAPVAEETSYPVLTFSDSVYYFSHPLFEMYKKQGVQQYKAMVHTIIDQIEGSKILEADLPVTADLILNHNKERRELILNFLHYIPQRKAIELDTIEAIIPLNNIQIKIDLNQIEDITEVKFVKEIRSEEILDFKHEKNFLKFTVKKIEGYQIILIKY